MALWLLCEHNAPSHRVIVDRDTTFICPGGHRATVEEVSAWLEAQPETEEAEDA